MILHDLSFSEFNVNLCVAVLCLVFVGKLSLWNYFCETRWIWLVLFSFVGCGFVMEDVDVGCCSGFLWCLWLVFLMRSWVNNVVKEVWWDCINKNRLSRNNWNRLLAEMCALDIVLWYEFIFSTFMWLFCMNLSFDIYCKYVC